MKQSTHVIGNTCRKLLETESWDTPNCCGRSVMREANYIADLVTVTVSPYMNVRQLVQGSAIACCDANEFYPTALHCIKNHINMAWVPGWTSVSLQFDSCRIIIIIIILGLSLNPSFYVWYVTSWSKVLLKFLVTWIKKYPSIC
jgi:hypothetical protein